MHQLQIHAIDPGFHFGCSSLHRLQKLKEGPQRLALLVALIVWFGGCGLPNSQSDQQQAKSMGKVGTELITLYDEYSSYLASGKKNGVFKPKNSLIQIIEDRVIVDAVASGDSNVLKADLEALGMKQAVAFGRVVSGQLPIRAIPSVAKLPSLNSVRAATAVLQETPRSPSPDMPNR